jgi:hypothetical protein
MRGNEEFLARPADPPIQLLIEELCRKLTAHQVAFVKNLVFQKQPLAAVRSDCAHRKMKQRLFRRVSQTLEGAINARVCAGVLRTYLWRRNKFANYFEKRTFSESQIALGAHYNFGRGDTSLGSTKLVGAHLNDRA